MSSMVFALDTIVGEIRRRGETPLVPHPPTPLDVPGFVLLAPGDRSVVYAREGDGPEPVFRVFFDRIEAYSDKEEDVRAMIDVATRLGWTSVDLSGRPSFVRMAGLECDVRKFPATGYVPTPLEEEHSDRIARAAFPEPGF